MKQWGYVLVGTLLTGLIDPSYAQEGFGTNQPNKASVIDLTSSSKGLLIPRVELIDLETFAPMQGVSAGQEHTANSLLVYNIANDSEAGITPGYYYWDQPDAATQGKWMRITNRTDISETGMPPYTKVFYMPSIVFDTSTTGTGLTRNLYNEYVAQFTGKKLNSDGTVSTVSSETFVSSTGAAPTIPILPNATDLYYYITDYDTTALDNLSIDENGVLTYNVIGTGTDYSLVNIVFVVK